MYRNVSSPIFDVPEFPTLRRVKPLPKRRETYKDSGDGSPATNGSQRTPVPESTNVQVNENDVPHITDFPFSLPNTLPSLPGPDATAEELLAHANALQSYYLPILDAAAANMANMAGMMGVNTLADVARVAGITNGKNIDKDDRGFGFDEDELSLAAATFGLSLRGERLGTDDESDGQGDGDYIDHLQQPGNTKKRKVPANAFTRFSGGGGDESSDFPGENEGSALTTYSPAGHLLGSDTGQDDGGGGAKNVPSSSPSGNPLSSPQSATHLLQNRVMNHHLHGRNTSRLSAVTLASLQQKETLKVRKRQLAAVLGALSVTAPAGLNGFTGHSQLGGIGTGSGAGDENTFAMALDQALSGAWTYPYSFPYPFTSSSFSSSMTSSTAGDASVSNAPATASGNDQKPFNNKPKIRLSKRAKPRTARLFKINEDATPPSTGADMNVESDLSKAIMKTKWSTKKNNKENGVLEGEFTFVFPSATSDRLTSTKMEVTTLRKRFEKELAKQAKQARQAKVVIRQGPGTGEGVKSESNGVGTGKTSSSFGGGKTGKDANVKKRYEGEREKEKERERVKKSRSLNQVRESEKSMTSVGNGNENGVDGVSGASYGDSAGVMTSNGTANANNVKTSPSTDSSPIKSKSKSKKKRSALANASNPHHLRNYVPSRVPGSGGGGGGAGAGGAGGHGGGAAGGSGGGNDANDFIGPFPWRLLGAEMPTRKKGKKYQQQHTRGATGGGGTGSISPSNSGSLPTTALSAPTDEWLCIFCEYQLFFGEELEYRRAVRKRKTVLKRRRRARERAEEVASGTRKGASAAKSTGNTKINGPPAAASGNQQSAVDGGRETEEDEEYDNGGADTELEEEKDRGGGYQGGHSVGVGNADGGRGRSSYG